MEPINSEVLNDNGIQSTYMDNICAICCEEIGCEDNVYTIPECGHEYHTDCIIKWFRQSKSGSSCPYCRSEPIDQSFNSITTNSGYQFNRKFANRKDAPTSLKSLVLKAKKEEEKFKEWNKNKRNWFKSNEGEEFKRLTKVFEKISGIKCIYRKAEHIFKNNKKLNCLKRQIAQYPIKQIVIRKNEN